MTSPANRGCTYFHGGEYAKALKQFEKQEKQCKNPQSLPFAYCLFNSGRTLLELHKPAQAIEKMQKAHALLIHTLGERDRKVALCAFNLGRAHIEQNAYSQALPFFKQAKPIYQQTCHPEHPVIAVCLYNQGNALYVQGLPRPAERSIRRAQQIFVKAHGSVHKTVSACKRKLQEIQSNP